MAAGMAVLLALLGSSVLQTQGRPGFLDLDNFPQTSALLLLKATLDPSGNSLPAWTTTTKPCTWPGLTCNQQGQVTSIDLAGRDLTGELPRDNRVWGALPAVTSVNLANNSIYGWVPPELSDLQQIQSLDLAHNTFQGPLAGMANLSRLENVSLTGNEMTGTLPASWANNTSLRSLDLSDNNFTGSLPQQWAALSQLQALNASHNSLSGTVPSTWRNGSMSSLTALVLGGNAKLCQAQDGRSSSAFSSLQTYQDPCSPTYQPMLAPATAPALAPYLAPAMAPMAEMAPMMAPAPAPMSVAAPELAPMMAPVPAPMAAAAPEIALMTAPAPAPMSMAAPVLAPTEAPMPAPVAAPAPELMAPAPAPMSMAAPVLAPTEAPMPAPVAAPAPELMAPAPGPVREAAPEMAPAMAPATAPMAPEQAPAPVPGMQQPSPGANVSLQLYGITAAQFADKEQQYNHIIAQAAGVPDTAVKTSVQQGGGGTPPTAAAGRRHILQATDQPLMLTSFISSSNPQHAQQSVSDVVASGALQQQLQGIGLNLVSGSANVGGQSSPSPAPASGSPAQPPTARSPSPVQGLQSGAAVPSPAPEQAAGQPQSAQAGSGGRRPGWQIAVIVIAVVVGVFLAITAVLVPYGLVRRNKRKQPKLQERYPRSDQPQPANGRGGSSEDKTTGGRSGGPDAGKRVLERGDDFERLPVPKAGRKKAGGGSEPLLQAGDSSFTSAKSVESFTSARSLPRDTSSLAGEASMPASSSGPSADAEDLYYDPAGGNESFLSTHSLGHSSTMSVDSFASAQSADREFFDSAEESRRGSLDPQERHSFDPKQPNRNSNPSYGHEGNVAAAAVAGAGAGVGMAAMGRPGQAPPAGNPTYSSGNRLTQGAMAGHPLTPDLSPRSDAWQPRSGNATPASMQGHPIAFDSGSAGVGSPALSPKPSDDMGSVQGHPLTFDSGSEGPGSVFGSLPNSGQVTPRARSMQGHPIGFDSGSDFGSPLGSSIRTPMGSGEVSPRAGSVQGHPIGFDSGSEFGSLMGSSANSPLGSGANTPRDLARMSPSQGHAGEADAAGTGAGMAGNALSAVPRPMHRETAPARASAFKVPETLSPAASQTIHKLTPVAPTRPAFPGTPRPAAPAPTPGRTVSFDIGHGPPRGPRQSMDTGADLAPGSELPSPVASRPTSMDNRPAAPPPSLAGRRNVSDLSIGQVDSARGTPYSSRPSSMDYGPRAPPPSVRGYALGSDLGSDVGSNIGSLPPSERPSFDIANSQRSLRGYAIGSDLGSDVGSNIGSLPPSGRPSLDMTGSQHPSLRGYPLSSSSQRSLRGYALGSDLGSEVGSNIGSLPPSRQPSQEVSGSQHPGLREYPPGSGQGSRQGSGMSSPEGGARLDGPPSVRGYALGSDFGSDMGSAPASGRPSFDIGEGRPSFDIGARPVRQSFDIGEGRPSFDFGGARAAGLIGHPLQGSGSLSTLSETGLTPAPSRPGSLDYQLRAPPPSAQGSDIGSEMGSRPASLDYGTGRQ